MRYFYLVLLVLLIGVVVLFAVQNQHDTTVSFLNLGSTNLSVTASVALVVAVVYVLGMVSGWTIFGFIRRSIIRATQSPPPR
jgi:hypothetical protein